MSGISPYISEGSGLKPRPVGYYILSTDISPYISEGSGLKLCPRKIGAPIGVNLPLHQ